ncbi:MAG: hypothetical protein IJO32_05490 [Bacilli bacterium]|nr:hypothetical protein [Bacilli bacterium]
MGIESKVKELIQEPLEIVGIHVDTIEYEKEGSNYFLRIIITSDKGIDLDECIKATNIINPILDENDIIENQYILDVCSKGGN